MELWQSLTLSWRSVERFPLGEPIIVRLGGACRRFQNPVVFDQSDIFDSEKEYITGTSARPNGFFGKQPESD